MRRGLIIFIRTPELGKVKTRLARTIGDTRALDIYCRLLKHTRNICTPMHAERYVYYAGGEPTEADWPRAEFGRVPQGEGDLGARMSGAFRQLFDRGCERVVIIGSDCPKLTSALVEEAFKALTEHDTVIGPARDGGYYLLGMKSLHPQFFQNKTWSTDKVLPDTLKDMTELGLTCYRLPMLTDVDEEADLPAMSHLL